MDVFDLWLPVLLAGLATHVISTLAWTALPHHKPEWVRVPAEDELVEFIAQRGIPARQYVFPHSASGAEAQSDAFKAKQARCRGLLILWEQPIGMGAAIVKTLAYFLFAAFSIGYLATLALPAGAGFAPVFRFVATAGLLTYCFAHFPHVFWFRRRIGWELVDGAVQSVVTGLIFAAMWPSA